MGNIFPTNDAPVLYMAGSCDWFNARKMEEILHQVPVQLKQEAEYEQQSLLELICVVA